MSNPSEVQRNILHYMHEYERTHGQAPTLRQIAKGVRLRSTSLVAAHLRSLERMGLVARADTDVYHAEQP